MLYFDIFFKKIIGGNLSRKGEGEGYWHCKWFFLRSSMKKHSKFLGVKSPKELKYYPYWKRVKKSVHS